MPTIARIARAEDLSAHIFSWRRQMVRRIWQQKDAAPKIVFGIFVCIIIVVVLAELFSFSHAFTYFADQPYFGPPLTLFVLEEFLLLTSALYLLSAIVSGFFMFFRANDLRLFFSTPVKIEKLFWLKYIEVTILSSWSFLIIGLPLIFAFGMATHATLLYYFFSIGVLLSLLAILSYISAIADFILLWLFHKTHTMVFISAVGAILLSIGYALINSIVPQNQILITIFDAENLKASIATTRHVHDLFLYLPSNYLAMTMQSTDIGVSMQYLGLCILIAIAGWHLCLEIARRLYTQLLLTSNERSLFVNADSRANHMLKGSSRVFPRVFTGTLGALFEKDLITIFRNFSELSRASFIFFLMIFYLSFILIASERIGKFSADIGTLILSFHFAAISYFISILALRYVYPSISLESRAAWVIWSSPLDIRKLIIEKFVFFSLFIYVPTVTLFVATASSFALSPAFVGTASILLLFLVSCIVSIALLFGTIFVNFHETSVDRLANSFGGLLTTVCSLLIGVLIGLLNYIISLHTSIYTQFLWLAFAACFSFALSSINISIALWRIRRLEIV